jgi:hypothetical protein
MVTRVAQKWGQARVASRPMIAATTIGSALLKPWETLAFRLSELGMNVSFDFGEMSTHEILFLAEILCLRSFLVHVDRRLFCCFVLWEWQWQKNLKSIVLQPFCWTFRLIVCHKAVASLALPQRLFLMAVHISNGFLANFTSASWWLQSVLRRSGAAWVRSCVRWCLSEAGGEARADPMALHDAGAGMHAA